MGLEVVMRSPGADAQGLQRDKNIDLRCKLPGLELSRCTHPNEQRGILIRRQQQAKVFPKEQLMQSTWKAA